MGDALFKLEQVLRSRKEQLTLHETSLLMAWRAQSIRDLTLGFGAGSLVTWLATQRLRNLYRLNIALGAGAACGMWRFGRSVKSSAQHILSLEGSRLQRELANIMLKKHHHDPWAMKHLSKYFYSEKVYDDSSVDKPTLRWRYRNFSGEPITHSHQTESHGEEKTESRGEEKTESKEKDVKKTTTLQPKQVHVNTVGNATESPFDLVFGQFESPENAPNPVEVGTLSRKQRRKEKRSRRRHGKHHHQEEIEI